jgi:hypothetical protein
LETEASEKGVEKLKMDSVNCSAANAASAEAVPLSLTTGLGTILVKQIPTEGDKSEDSSRATVKDETNAVVDSEVVATMKYELTQAALDSKEPTGTHRPQLVAGISAGAPFALFTFPRIGIKPSVTAVAAGRAHVVVALSSGEVYAWGDVSRGRCGSMKPPKVWKHFL